MGKIATTSMLQEHQVTMKYSQSKTFANREGVTHLIAKALNTAGITLLSG
jgi:hypothetical protein